MNGLTIYKMGGGGEVFISNGPTEIYSGLGDLIQYEKIVTVTGNATARISGHHWIIKRGDTVTVTFSSGEISIKHQSKNPFRAIRLFTGQLLRRGK